MRAWLIYQLFLLLVITNAMPVIASLLAGRRWNWPLDGNRLFLDHKPLLGPSKTLRGVVAAVVVTALVAPLFDLTLTEGALFALLAMAGDLCSSFLKRRLVSPPAARYRYWINYRKRCYRCGDYKPRWVQPLVKYW